MLGQFLFPTLCWSVLEQGKFFLQNSCCGKVVHFTKLCTGVMNSSQKKKKNEINHESVMTGWQWVGCREIIRRDWLEKTHFIKINLALCVNYLLTKLILRTENKYLG